MKINSVIITHFTIPLKKSVRIAYVIMIIEGHIIELAVPGLGIETNTDIVKRYSLAGEGVH